MRPSWPSQSHKESSEGFPEVPEDEEAKQMPVVAPDRRANWLASALFTPTQLPPHDSSSGSPLHEADQEPSGLRQVTFDMVPSASANMMLFGTSMLGATQPEQSTKHAVLPHVRAAMQGELPPQQPNPGPRPPSNIGVGQALDFAAAYPMHSMMNEEPVASVYDDSFSKSGVRGCVTYAGASLPQGYGWVGAGGFGSQGQVMPVSQSAFADCDQFSSGTSRTKSEFAAHAQRRPAPAMHNQNMCLMLDKPHTQPFTNGNTGLDIFGTSSLPVCTHCRLSSA